ncbi:MAG TPA: sulfatase, partial [Thermoanaerobaculia bacterium]|nr:sulfatase [Thermoanaerobaculia bacterium]
MRRRRDEPHALRRLAVLLPCVALVTLATVALGCGRGGAPRYRDAPVVLISIDTLRSDHLPAYGYQRVDTPAIDALRRDGILFRRAYSNVPLTLPSHVTMFSGQLPPVHGVRDNSGFTYKEGKLPTLPSLLKRAGYATGGAVSAIVLRAGTGVETGFDFYDAPESPEVMSLTAQRSGEETLQKALPWLRGVESKKFFLFFHLYEPHTPYEPPASFRARYKSLYDGEIAAADAVVGELVAELKRAEIYDRAIVVLLSDHGEAFGEHGEEGHGVFLYRETLQVPLIVKLPGQARAGEASEAPVELADLYPTLAALLGLEVPEKAQLAGRPALGAPAPPDPEGQERALYAESLYPYVHYGWAELTSLIRGRYHYQEGPQPELFDLVDDPGETKNLRAERRREAA